MHTHKWDRTVYDIPMEVCADGGNPFVAVKTRKGNILELEKGIFALKIRCFENGKGLPRFSDEPGQSFRPAVFAGKEQLRNLEGLAKS